MLPGKGVPEAGRIIVGHAHDHAPGTIGQRAQPYLRTRASDRRDRQRHHGCVRGLHIRFRRHVGGLPLVKDHRRGRPMRRFIQRPGFREPALNGDQDILRRGLATIHGAGGADGGAHAASQTGCMAQADAAVGGGDCIRRTDTAASAAGAALRPGIGAAFRVMMHEPRLLESAGHARQFIHNLRKILFAAVRPVISRYRQRPGRRCRRPHIEDQIEMVGRFIQQPGKLRLFSVNAGSRMKPAQMAPDMNIRAAQEIVLREGTCFIRWRIGRVEQHQTGQVWTQATATGHDQCDVPADDQRTPF